MANQRTFEMSSTRWFSTPLGAIVSAVVVILGVCLFTQPRWETNDDIAMSMVAHGYGIAAKATSHIIFSNVLWGEIVEALQGTGGSFGYSIATVAVLAIVAAVLIFALSRFGLGAAHTALVLAIVLARPLLFPQFTLNAGLLSASASLLWMIYGQERRRYLVVWGCGLFFLAFLVRESECAFVAAVSVPFLPWRAFRSDRFAALALGALVIFLAVAKGIDLGAYDGAAWQPFNALNSARAPFTDFGLADALQRHPDIPQRYGYSENDVALIRDWFFVDPAIADPDKLRSMGLALGLSAVRESVAQNISAAFSSLWSPDLRAVFLAAVLILALLPGRRLLLAWLAFILCLLVLAAAGRPAISRVYFPALCLIAIAPLIEGDISAGCRRLVLGGHLVLAVLAIGHFGARSRVEASTSGAIRAALAEFPREPVVIWGAGLPFESIYPVLGHTAFEAVPLYGLGVFTLAPFSVATAEEAARRGLLARLADKDGEVFIVSNRQVSELRTYCEEHFSGELQLLDKRDFVYASTVRYRCLPAR